MSAMVNGNSKYARKYLDGERVYGHGQTFGIFVFKTLRAAESWVFQWNDGYEAKDLIILKVIPLGRGKSMTFVAADPSTDSIELFYDNSGSAFAQSAPENTMAYPGVFVIGEYEYVK